MTEVANYLDIVATWLFRNVVMWLLLASGAYLTVRYGVVQLRRLPEAFRAMIAQQSKSASGGVLTPFQSFMTALGASIGTGNIAGVAVAIITGGPGALFWIWVYGFVATAIKFTEAVLGVKYREASGEQLRCGPMYYLRDGLKSPALAWIYALVAGVAALTTTPFTQPNSIAVAVNSVFGIPTWIVGVVVAVLTWAVIIGGVKSIGRVAEKLAPLKVGLYLVGGLIVIFTFADRLPYVFSLVFEEALGHALGDGLRHLHCDALRHRARHLRERSRLRHGRSGLWHRKDDGPVAAGPAGGDGSVHRVVRHRDDQRDGHSGQRRGRSVDCGRPQRSGVRHEHCGRREGVRHGDPDGRRLDRGVLRVSVRLHDADWLGVLRRAVSRIHPGPQRHDAVSLDLLPADPVRRRRAPRRRLELGRPDERAPGVPESDRPGRPQRRRRRVRLAPTTAWKRGRT